LGPVCLVTGGAGYLGGFLIQRLLEKGVRVHSFDLAPAHESDDRVTSFVGDIRNYGDLRAACEGVSTVFHTAAVINLLGLYHARQRDFVMDVNVGGTAQILKAAADAGVKRFVYTSSNNVSFDREIINGDETTPYATRPLDLYTETKGMAERLVLAADNGKTGMRTTAIRPGGIWGGSEGGVMITTFLDQLASGKFKATVGDGSAVVDNTHIDNLVLGEMLAAEKLVTDPDRVGGEAYYILDEEPMNGILWFKPLVDGLGLKWPGMKVPKWLVYFSGYITEVIHYLGGPEPSVSRISALKITRSHTFSTAKARRELGYRPVVGQVEGLKAILPHARELLERFKAK
jgi:3beta-hydroxy-delta5-steroid dehydrogenase/steroid delta-isomerase